MAEETASEPSEEMVGIHEASIEDLDAALAAAQKGETWAVSEEEVSKESPPLPQSLPENASTNGVPTSISKEETPREGQEASKPALTQEEIQAILAENQQLKQSTNQKELFIQHRGNELGRLRQELAQTRQQLLNAKAQLEADLENRFQENPVQASNDRDRIKEIDKEIQNLDTREERASRIVESQSFFLRHVDTEKVSLDDVANILKDDGLGEQYVAAFKANPWEFTTPEALVQMGKRAMDKKAFSEADSDRRILAKHVLDLRKEIETLKKRPSQVVHQMQRALNQPPTVTATSSAPAKAPVGADPSKMSIAELDAALRQAMS